jgi:putative nucleotidyltransferase with HDIG domain
MWWLRIREMLVRDGAVRETRTPAGSVKTGAAEIRRSTPSPWWPVGAALFLLVLHLVLFPPVPRLASDFPNLGEIAEREIRAPFSFDAPLLDADVQMRRLERVVIEPPVLRVLDDAAGQDGKARMEVWLSSLAAELGDVQSSPGDRAGILALQFPGVDADDLRRLLRADQPDSLVPRMDRAWRQVLRGGVADLLPPGRYDRVVVASERAETLRDRSRITAQSDLEERLTAELRSAGLPPVEAVEAAAVMRHFVTPNLVYDQEESDLRRNAARETVPTRREFISGERIIDQGVRVTEQQALFLEQLESLILSRGGGESAGARLVRGVGRGALVALVLGLFGWLGHIHVAGPQKRPRMLVAQTVILGLFLGGAAVALGRTELGHMAVPIVLLSLLSTVLLKGRAGYMATLLAVSLLAVLPGVQGLHVFSWFLVGMATVVSVRRIQKRSQFYQTIVLLTALSLLMVFLQGLVGDGDQRPGGGDYVVAVFAPVLSVAFGLFLLPVVEPLVGVCSDLTLLELSDLNHPLLQRMALESQGTYHHSQVVGQLAEHAARAIDANALLVRVGALFHDIGKMQKPEYYVENQRPDYNKHDELSPSMSALVIAAHVKEGIELARKWRLPQQVIDFIPEHHGTMVMEYFYHKALEADGNETVKVDDFRYPGPKPRSRETAVLMLADATEAATRSLAKPTPGRIREVTKQVIDKRMLSGEMDESGLTLSDLARIREAFIPLLVGIHHARIQYPGQRDREAERAAERRAERKART